MVDALFADARLAAIYDLVDDDRRDLDAYAALIDELGAASVVDVGCGTGTFACLLASRGIDVVGVDPAEASLDVARRKPYAERVRWVLGDASALPPLAVAVDVATMTGNVAQVLVDDEEWTATIGNIRDALRPGGWFVFETRDPAYEGWQEWTRERSQRRITMGRGRTVDTWVELTNVDLPLVSFRWTYTFEPGGEVLTSDSTLRFRSRRELTQSLDDAGFTTAEVRDAPDRPGRELVFVARR